MGRSRRRSGGGLLKSFKHLFSRKPRFSPPLGPGSVFGTSFEKYLETLSRRNPQELKQIEGEMGNATQLIGDDDKVEYLKLSHPRMTVPVYVNRAARLRAEKSIHK